MIYTMFLIDLHYSKCIQKEKYRKRKNKVNVNKSIEIPQITLGFFPVIIRDIWSPRLNASLKRILVCIDWNPGNQDNNATGAITTTPNIMSYSRATATTVSQTKVDSINGLITCAIKIRPHPVGINAKRLVKRSTISNLVNLSNMTITRITRMMMKDWTAR